MNLNHLMIVLQDSSSGPLGATKNTFMFRPSLHSDRVVNFELTNSGGSILKDGPPTLLNG